MGIDAAHHHIAVPSHIVADDGHHPPVDLFEGSPLLAILA
jgi:hypothetical protein